MMTANIKPGRSIPIQNRISLRKFSFATGFELEAIERAFGLFQGHAWNGLQVDHCGFDVAVPEQSLDRLEVVVGEQQMTCEGVTEGVGGNALHHARPGRSLFDGALNMGLVQVVTPLFPQCRNEG